MSWVSTMLRNWKGKGVDFFKTKMRPAINRQHNPFANFDWGDTNWSGLAGTATSMLGEGIDSAVGMNEKQKFYATSIANYGQGLYDNLSDNSSLIMAGMMPAMSTVEQRDIRDKTWGEDIGSSFMNGISAGLSTGNPYIGIGVAALDFANNLRERFMAKSTADDLERQRKDRMRLLGGQYYAAAQGVDEQNDFNRLMSYFDYPYDFAFGGPLHSNGGDYNGGLTYIDEGGRHEDNPYEGVPSGFDAEGNPNLVEEGEVIWNNDYVFSDRLKVPKELATKYKLGGKKDYTFAEAIEKLTKENNISPNDFITIATTKEIVNEFMDAQEALRQEEQIAAREELEAAQAQDFLAQLDAAQGMAPLMGAPVDMGQMGMGMPNEAPVTEGEMTPPGYAFGGNKFQNGSWKNYVTEGKDKSGTPIFTTSDGRVFYSEAGARKYVDLNKEYLVSRLPSFVASPAPARVVADAPRQSLPAGIKAVYSKGRNGQRGPVHHYETSDGLNMGTDLDKAIRHQNALDGVSASAQEVAAPMVQEPVVPALPNLVSSSTVPASTVTATRTLPAAQPRVQQMAQPQVAAQQVQPEVTINSKGQEEETLPDGIKVVYSKGRNGNRGPVHHYETSDGLNMGTNRDKAINYQTRLNQKNVQASAARTVPSPSFQDINIFGTPDGGFDLFSYAPQDYVNAPVAQTASQPQSVAAPVEARSSVPVSPAVQSSGKTSGSGSVSRMATPSGETINYRRDINGRDWESAEPYQNFLSYMRGKGKDSPEAKEWMDYIQSEIKNSGSKYELKNFDDWSRLAEDGKVGPVHQATLKAAEYFARRQGLTAVNPNGGPNPTIAEVLGVKPESVAGAPQNPVSGSTQASSESGTAQGPQFNYRDTRLRYAPVVGSAMATLYGMLNRPDYSNADRIIDAAYRMGAPINIPVETIGDYRRRNPFDERYLVNMANQNRAAAARGIANTAGGNRAMDLLGNMSLAHNSQQELGEIMRQAYLANRQDDAQVADFNRGTNVYNMNAINQRNLSQAQLNTHRQQAGLSGLTQGYGLRQGIKDSWDSATMESLNSMLASLGAIGKENEEYNILTSMAEQGYFPHYYRDRGIINFVRPTKNGGKLNRKKRRF